MRIKVVVNSRNEFGILAEVFNEMTEKLQTLIREKDNKIELFEVLLEKVKEVASGQYKGNLHLPSDVYGYKEHISNINTLISNANELQVTKENLLKNEAITTATQMLAHDVRKPFTMVQGMMELTSNAKSIEEVKAITTQSKIEIDRAIKSVNSMINDVMEVGATSDLIIEDCNIETLIDLSLTDHFKYNNEKNISFDYKFKHKNQVSIDIFKIGRVFSNLLSNATEAVKDGGKIWFSQRITTRIIF